MFGLRSLSLDGRVVRFWIVYVSTRTRATDSDYECRATEGLVHCIVSFVDLGVANFFFANGSAREEWQLR